MSDLNNRLYTLAECAEYLEMSVAQTLELVGQSKLEPISMTSMCFNQAAIDRFMVRHVLDRCHDGCCFNPAPQLDLPVEVSTFHLQSQCNPVFSFNRLLQLLG